MALLEHVDWSSGTRVEPETIMPPPPPRQRPRAQLAPPTGAPQPPQPPAGPQDVHVIHVAPQVVGQTPDEPEHTRAKPDVGVVQKNIKSIVGALLVFLALAAFKYTRVGSF